MLPPQQRKHETSTRVLCHAYCAGFLVCILLTLGPKALVAADFRLGSGDLFDLGTGTLDLECGSFTLQSTATFLVGGGNLSLSGDWNNHGAFDGADSTVTFNDDCGAASTSAITGATRFHSLIASTTAAHRLQLESGRRQSVANALVLSGSPSLLLEIRSSIPGNPAFLELDQAGSQSVSYVDVQDNHAPVPGQHLAPGRPAFFNSVDSGGNSRWFLFGPTPAPVLSKVGLVMATLLMTLVGLHSMLRLRRAAGRISQVKGRIDG